MDFKKFTKNIIQVVKVLLFLAIVLGIMGIAIYCIMTGNSPDQIYTK